MDTTEMPDVLKPWVLILAGQSWPESHEGEIYAMGELFSAYGEELGQLAAAVPNLVEGVVAGAGGAVGEQFAQYLELVVEVLDGAGAAAMDAGPALLEAAVQIAYEKYMIIAMMLLALEQIAELVAVPWAALEILFLEAACRESILAIVRMVAEQLVKSVAVMEAVQVSISLLVQMAQMEAGQRSGIDLKLLQQTAVQSAIAGVVDVGLHVSAEAVAPGVAKALVGKLLVSGLSGLTGTGLTDAVYHQGDAGLGFGFFSGAVTGGLVRTGLEAKARMGQAARTLSNRVTEALKSVDELAEQQALFFATRQDSGALADAWSTLKSMTPSLVSRLTREVGAGGEYGPAWDAAKAVFEAEAVAFDEWRESQGETGLSESDKAEAWNWFKGRVRGAVPELDGGLDEATGMGPQGAGRARLADGVEANAGTGSSSASARAGEETGERPASQNPGQQSPGHVAAHRQIAALGGELPDHFAAAVLSRNLDGKPPTDSIAGPLRSESFGESGSLASSQVHEPLLGIDSSTVRAEGEPGSPAISDQARLDAVFARASDVAHGELSVWGHGVNELAASILGEQRPEDGGSPMAVDATERLVSTEERASFDDAFTGLDERLRQELAGSSGPLDSDRVGLGLSAVVAHGLRQDAARAWHAVGRRGLGEGLPLRARDIERARSRVRTHAFSRLSAGIETRVGYARQLQRIVTDANRAFDETMAGRAYPPGLRERFISWHVEALDRAWHLTLDKKQTTRSTLAELEPDRGSRDSTPEGEPAEHGRSVAQRPNAEGFGKFAGLPFTATLGTAHLVDAGDRRLPAVSGGVPQWLGGLNAETWRSLLAGAEVVRVHTEFAEVPRRPVASLAEVRRGLVGYEVRRLRIPEAPDDDATVWHFTDRIRLKSEEDAHVTPEQLGRVRDTYLVGVEELLNHGQVRMPDGGRFVYQVDFADDTIPGAAADGAYRSVQVVRSPDVGPTESDPHTQATAAPVHAREVSQNRWSVDITPLEAAHEALHQLGVVHQRDDSGDLMTDGMLPANPVLRPAHLEQIDRVMRSQVVPPEAAGYSRPGDDRYEAWHESSGSQAAVRTLQAGGDDPPGGSGRARSGAGSSRGAVTSSAGVGRLARSFAALRLTRPGERARNPQAPGPASSGSGVVGSRHPSFPDPELSVGGVVGSRHPSFPDPGSSAGEVTGSRHPSFPVSGGPGVSTRNQRRDETVSVTSASYAQTAEVDAHFARVLEIMLQGDPVDVGEVLIQLSRFRSTAGAEPAAKLGRALQARGAQPFGTLIRAAVQDRRMPHAVAQDVHHLLVPDARLGEWLKQFGSSAYPVGESPKDLPNVRAYANAMADELKRGRPDRALRMTEALDRDLRRIWALKAAWTDTQGSDLYEVLSAALPGREAAVTFHLGTSSFTAAPYAQIAAWYRMLADSTFEHEGANVRIPFDYPENGCFARSHEMALRLIQWGVLPDKIAVSYKGYEGGLRVLSLNAREATSLRPETINWRYHIAPVVYEVAQGEQVNRLFVLDPSLGRGPLTEHEWLAAINVDTSRHIDRILGPVPKVYDLVQKAYEDNPDGFVENSGGLLPRESPIVVISEAHLDEMPLPQVAHYPKDLWEAEVRTRKFHHKFVAMVNDKARNHDNIPTMDESDSARRAELNVFDETADRMVTHALAHPEAPVPEAHITGFTSTDGRGGEGAGMQQAAAASAALRAALDVRLSGPSAQGLRRLRSSDFAFHLDWAPNPSDPRFGYGSTRVDAHRDLAAIRVSYSPAERVRLRPASTEDRARILYAEAAHRYEEKLSGYLLGRPEAKGNVSSLIQLLWLSAALSGAHATVDSATRSRQNEILQHGNIREQIALLQSMIKSGLVDHLTGDLTPPRFDDGEEWRGAPTDIPVPPGGQRNVPERSSREWALLGAGEQVSNEASIGLGFVERGAYPAAVRGPHAEAQATGGLVLAGTSVFTWQALDVADAVRLRLQSPDALDLQWIKLALAGYLVNTRSNSLREVLNAAAEWGRARRRSGFEFEDGWLRYRSLSPLTEAELRSQVAIDETFPDEVAGGLSVLRTSAADWNFLWPFVRTRLRQVGLGHLEEWEARQAYEEEIGEQARAFTTDGLARDIVDRLAPEPMRLQGAGITDRFVHDDEQSPGAGPSSGGGSARAARIQSAAHVADLDGSRDGDPADAEAGHDNPRVGNLRAWLDHFQQAGGFDDGLLARVNHELDGRPADRFEALAAVYRGLVPPVDLDSADAVAVRLSQAIRRARLARFDDPGLPNAEAATDPYVRSLIERPERLDELIDRLAAQPDGAGAPALTPARLARILINAGDLPSWMSTADDLHSWVSYHVRISERGRVEPAEPREVLSANADSPQRDFVNRVLAGASGKASVARIVHALEGGDVPAPGPSRAEGSGAAGGAESRASATTEPSPGPATAVAMRTEAEWLGRLRVEPGTAVERSIIVTDSDGLDAGSALVLARTIAVLVHQVVRTESLAARWESSNARIVVAPDASLFPHVGRQEPQGRAIFAHGNMDARNGAAVFLPGQNVLYVPESLAVRLVARGPHDGLSVVHSVLGGVLTQVFDHVLTPGQRQAVHQLYDEYVDSVNPHIYTQTTIAMWPAELDARTWYVHVALHYLRAYGDGEIADGGMGRASAAAAFARPLRRMLPILQNIFGPASAGTFMEIHSDRLRVFAGERRLHDLEALRRILARDAADQLVRATGSHGSIRGGEPDTIDWMTLERSLAAFVYRSTEADGGARLFTGDEGLRIQRTLSQLAEAELRSGVPIPGQREPGELGRLSRLLGEAAAQSVSRLLPERDAEVRAAELALIATARPIDNARLRAWNRGFRAERNARLPYRFAHVTGLMPAEALAHRVPPGSSRAVVDLLPRELRQALPESVRTLATAVAMTLGDDRTANPWPSLSRLLSNARGQRFFLPTLLEAASGGPQLLRRVADVARSRAVGVPPSLLHLLGRPLDGDRDRAMSDARRAQLGPQPPAAGHLDQRAVPDAEHVAVLLSLVSGNRERTDEDTALRRAVAEGLARHIGPETALRLRSMGVQIVLQSRDEFRRLVQVEFPDSLIGIAMTRADASGEPRVHLDPSLVRAGGEGLAPRGLVRQAVIIRTMLDFSDAVLHQIVMLHRMAFGGYADRVGRPAQVGDWWRESPDGMLFGPTGEVLLPRSARTPFEYVAGMADALNGTNYGTDRHTGGPVRNGAVWALAPLDTEDRALLTSLFTSGDIPQQLVQPPALRTFARRQARVLLAVLSSADVDTDRLHAFVSAVRQAGERDLGEIGDAFMSIAGATVHTAMEFARNRFSDESSFRGALTLLRDVGLARPDIHAGPHVGTAARAAARRLAELLESGPPEAESVLSWARQIEPWTEFTPSTAADAFREVTGATLGSFLRDRAEHFSQEGGFARVWADFEHRGLVRPFELTGADYAAAEGLIRSQGEHGAGVDYAERTVRAYLAQDSAARPTDLGRLSAAFHALRGPRRGTIEDWLAGASGGSNGRLLRAFSIENLAAPVDAVLLQRRDPSREEGAAAASARVEVVRSSIRALALAYGVDDEAGLDATHSSLTRAERDMSPLDIATLVISRYFGGHGAADDRLMSEYTPDGFLSAVIARPELLGDRTEPGLRADTVRALVDERRVRFPSGRDEGYLTWIGHLRSDSTRRDEERRDEEAASEELGPERQSTAAQLRERLSDRAQFRQELLAEVNERLASRGVPRADDTELAAAADRIDGFDPLEDDAAIVVEREILAGRAVRDGASSAVDAWPLEGFAAPQRLAELEDAVSDELYRLGLEPPAPGEIEGILRDFGRQNVPYGDVGELDEPLVDRDRLAPWLVTRMIWRREGMPAHSHSRYTGAAAVRFGDLGRLMWPAALLRRNDSLLSLVELANQVLRGPQEPELPRHPGSGGSPATPAEVRELLQGFNRTSRGPRGAARDSPERWLVRRLMEERWAQRRMAPLGLTLSEIEGVGLDHLFQAAVEHMEDVTADLVDRDGFIDALAWSEVDVAALLTLPEDLDQSGPGIVAAGTDTPGAAAQLIAHAMHMWRHALAGLSAPAQGFMRRDLWRRETARDYAERLLAEMSSRHSEQPGYVAGVLRDDQASRLPALGVPRRSPDQARSGRTQERLLREMGMSSDEETAAAWSQVVNRRLRGVVATEADWPEISGAMARMDSRKVSADPDLDAIGQVAREILRGRAAGDRFSLPLHRVAEDGVVDRIRRRQHAFPRDGRVFRERLRAALDARGVADDHDEVDLYAAVDQMPAWMPRSTFGDFLHDGLVAEFTALERGGEDRAGLPAILEDLARSPAASRSEPVARAHPRIFDPEADPAPHRWAEAVNHRLRIAGLLGNGSREGLRAPVTTGELSRIEAALVRAGVSAVDPVGSVAALTMLARMDHHDPDIADYVVRSIGRTEQRNEEWGTRVVAGLVNHRLAAAGHAEVGLDVVREHLRLPLTAGRAPVDAELPAVVAERIIRSARGALPTSSDDAERSLDVAPTDANGAPAEGLLPTGAVPPHDDSVDSDTETTVLNGLARMPASVGPPVVANRAVMRHQIRSTLLALKDELSYLMAGLGSETSLKRQVSADIDAELALTYRAAPVTQNELLRAVAELGLDDDYDLDGLGEHTGIGSWMAENVMRHRIAGASRPILARMRLGGPEPARRYADEVWSGLARHIDAMTARRLEGGGRLRIDVGTDDAALASALVQVDSSAIAFDVRADPSGPGFLMRIGAAVARSAGRAQTALDRDDALVRTAATAVMLFGLSAEDFELVMHLYRYARNRPATADVWPDGPRGTDPETQTVRENRSSATPLGFFAGMADAFNGSNRGTDPISGQVVRTGQGWVRVRNPLLAEVLDRNFSATMPRRSAAGEAQVTVMEIEARYAAALYLRSGPDPVLLSRFRTGFEERHGASPDYRQSFDREFLRHTGMTPAQAERLASDAAGGSSTDAAAEHLHGSVYNTAVALEEQVNQDGGVNVIGVLTLLRRHLGRGGVLPEDERRFPGFPLSEDSTDAPSTHAVEAMYLRVHGRPLVHNLLDVYEAGGLSTGNLARVLRELGFRVGEDRQAAPWIPAEGAVPHGSSADARVDAARPEGSEREASPSDSSGISSDDIVIDPDLAGAESQAEPPGVAGPLQVPHSIGASPNAQLPAVSSPAPSSAGSPGATARDLSTIAGPRRVRPSGSLRTRSRSSERGRPAGD